ncbi:hypothetical protein PDE_02818 [Penicillium oxalicum 114-2]|uniref:Restriction of telomere capping protein 4 n=1 Tax=Penicillium oxalicum (strain 114-2 / CGMCC 5302) TaxID=933388 RepID=S7ZCA4_PENO1|nr:hypothetical protein PDE_02818 [Penicillium oxalicum 114-2]
MRPHGGNVDSSYRAAAGLKRANLGGHLLSTFNKPKEKENGPKPDTSDSAVQALSLSSDAEELSDLDSADMLSESEFELLDARKSTSKTQDSTPLGPNSSIGDHARFKVTREPAIDDEPLSTEEEISDRDLDFQIPKKRPALETYEEKKRSGRGRDVANESDGESLVFHSSWRSQSSQRSKRVKRNMYGSNPKIRVPKYVARPSASPGMGSSQSESSDYKDSRKENIDKTGSSTTDGGMSTTRKLKPSSPKLAQSSSGSKISTTPPIDSNPSSSFAISSFKEPLSLDLDEDDDSGLSSLSSPPSSLASEPDEPRPALCPMCKKEVDPQQLELFLAQPKQRVREQERFCASHQQGSVEKEWEAQGLPSINWDTFDRRIQTHFASLERLLIPDCTSYYRNILEETLKTGKAQNFRLTLAGDGIETISCGYYGTKGSGKMLQALTDRFAVKLRRLATSDRIVKQAGVVGYTQSVLVPELAVRLVKEDMRVSDDAARQILRESIGLGEKMNPATDDDIPIPDDLAASFEDGI